MTVRIGQGRMVIDHNGSVRFDSDEGLFHTVHAFSGLLNVDAINVAGDYVNLTNRFVIGPCHSACTDVIGAIRFELDNIAAGMAFDRWHTVLGGSVLWLLDGESGVQISIGSNTSTPQQFVSYTFEVVSGQVVLDQRVVLDRMPTGVVYQVRPHRIRWYLEAGLFT